MIRNDNTITTIPSLGRRMERPEATTDGADYGGLKTLVDATIAALGHVPRELSGDVGFCNETNIEAGIRGYVAPGRARHGKSGDVGKWRIKPGTRMTAMARRALQPLSAQKADRRARRRPDQSSAVHPRVVRI